jgi:menaquinone-9 beta-reductase
MAPYELRIVGAGPAGSAAAIAAVTTVGAVRIFERSRSEHHKVCGEFISPEACRLLEAFGVWDDFLGRNPAGITRCILHFGSRTKEWRLAEPGFGLSRLALDRLLLRRATALGAAVCHDPNPPAMGTAAAPVIAASGRRSAASRGRRLFGYKAHFQGPANDAVELYFSRVGYMGVSAVEDNLTNVCGLAPEDMLRRYDFRIDDFLSDWPAARSRLRLLTRTMPWLRTGPLTFSSIRREHPGGDFVYPVGDALGFVDPFTGSGILNALMTGWLAGKAAARGVPSTQYTRQCRLLLRRAFTVSALFRAVWRAGFPQAALLIPGEWLYRLTRVRVPAFDAE